MAKKTTTKKTTTKKVAKKAEKLVDFSKYDDYKVIGENIMFLNPHTGIHIQVQKTTKVCPITSKPF